MLFCCCCCWWWCVCVCVPFVCWFYLLDWWSTIARERVSWDMNGTTSTTAQRAVCLCSISFDLIHTHTHSHANSNACIFRAPSMKGVFFNRNAFVLRSDLIIIAGQPMFWWLWWCWWCTLARTWRYRVSLNNRSIYGFSLDFVSSLFYSFVRLFTTKTLLKCTI